jgi:hypothetical protein
MSADGLTSWLLFEGQRRVEIICSVDIEQTFDSLHAHAIPEDIVLRPGDRVIVHDAPMVPFGQSRVLTCRATVIRAGRIERIWTEFRSLFELTELYHCGFEPKEAG